MTAILLADLRSYFETKSKSDSASLEQEGREIVSEISDILDQLEDVADRFKDTGEEKEAEYANNFSQRLMTSVENIIEPESFRDYHIFMKDLETLITGITRAAKQNLPRIISKLNRSNLKLFNTLYKKLIERSKELSDFIQHSMPELVEIDLISTKISELERLLHQKEVGLISVPELESKMNSIEKEIEHCEEKLAEISKDAKFARFEEIEKQISLLASEFAQELASVSKSLDKIKKMCDAGRFFMDKHQKEVLSVYSSTPFDAVRKYDLDLSILITILKTIQTAISEKKLTLKDKQRQKTIETIERIKSGSLKVYIDKYISLKKEEDSMTTEIEQSGLKKQKKEIKAKKTELKISFNSIQAELSDILRKKESIDLKTTRLKEEIEQKFHDVFNEKITIAI